MTRGEVPELPEGAEVNQEEWERFYDMFGHARVRRIVQVLSRLPADPRCEACGSPFAGIGGRVLSRFGRSPSRKNPRWCSVCFEESPSGGAIVTTGVLFADVRGSTELGEARSPGEVVELLNRFYEQATRVVLRHGLVDKLIGDEVMGLYMPPLTPDGRYVEAMVQDALELLEAVGYGSEAGPPIEVGVGLDVGPAFVGHVGEGAVSDFTAIGDVVNTASRLQSSAAGGEVVMPEWVAQRAGLAPEEGRREELLLKGKALPIEARVVTVGT
jgi:adenylate cyclase